MTLRENAPNIVLRYLMDGGTIEDQGIQYQMSEDNKLCWIGHKKFNETVLFEADWNFNGFIEYCTSLPEEELVRIAASNALNSIRREENATKSY